MEDILVEIDMEVAEAIAETALKKVNDKKQKNYRMQRTVKRIISGRNLKRDIVCHCQHELCDVRL